MMLFFMSAGLIDENADYVTSSKSDFDEDVFDTIDYTEDDSDSPVKRHIDKRVSIFENASSN